MKKTILIGLVSIVALVLVLSFSACGNTKGNTETKSLYAQGIEVVQLMSEMTQTEEYVEFHTGNGEIKEIVKQLGTADYSVPKAVYEISITEETLAGMTEFNDMTSASEELKEFLMQRTLSALMTQVTAMGGVENLAAASVCTVGKTFINENADANSIYLYTYDNAAPVAVTFIVGEDQTVSANGVFVLYDRFTCDSADEIKSFFSDISVEVTEVLLEK
mgnify:CR=1 FL=1